MQKFIINFVFKPLLIKFYNLEYLIFQTFFKNTGTLDSLEKMASNEPNGGGLTSQSSKSAHQYHSKYKNIAGFVGSGANLPLIDYVNTPTQQVFTNDFFDELLDKYSLSFNGTELDQLNLNQKLEEIRNYLKNEIYKQYKLQEGAEKMRSATTDKKRLNNLISMIKESNTKINELNQELNELNSYIVITQSESSLVLDPITSRSKNFSRIFLFF